MEKDKTFHATDGAYSGEAPTLSGYRQYVAVMTGKDQERKRALEIEQFEQWQKHWFKPKPAIVHYEQLYNSERQISGGSRSSYFKQGVGVVEHARDKQLPRLNDPADRKSAVKYIKQAFGQWERDYQALWSAQ